MHQIFWGTGGGGSPTITLLLSTDGGSTFPTTIASGLANNGAYSWTIPSMTTTATAMVKVEAITSGSVAASATSASDFTINGTSPPSGGGGGGGGSTPPPATPPPTTPAPSNGSFQDTTSTFPTGAYDPTQYSGAEMAAPASDPSVAGAYDAGAASSDTPSIDVDKGILPPPPSVKLPCTGGDLIKTRAVTTVYYCAKNGGRYDFPNEKTYASWFANFAAVKTVTDVELASVPLKGNITYKPGVRLIKIQTDPKVYAVARDGVLRWVTSEALAAQLYGSDWNTKVDDLSDAFFTDYTIGDPITSAQ